MSNELIQLDGSNPAGLGRKKFKTMLLFPPEWVPTAPYLALPSLTAVLREHGHEVIQKDINIEMYDWFLQRHLSHLGENSNGSATKRLGYEISGWSLGRSGSGTT